MNPAYHEFRVPIPVRIIASGPGCKWPAGKATAYDLWRMHLDHHVLWQVTYGDGGE